ncbi:hypothetical protein ACP4OV_029767 [Aristida adscensionis]
MFRTESPCRYGGACSRAPDDAALAGSFSSRSWGRREGTPGGLVRRWPQTATSSEPCSTEQSNPCPYPPASNDDSNPNHVGGTVHASILKDNIVKDYREEQRDQALKALQSFVEICAKAEVPAEILMTENDNVSAGLLELIADHKITKLIIVGIGRSWVNKSRRNLAAALQRDADPSCNILFLQKGTLISVRQPDGSIIAFETIEASSFGSSRRFSIARSSSYNSSNPSPLIDSRSTPSSFFCDSRSTPDSFDPLQLDDPSLENAGSMFDENRLYAILGPESITTFRGLAACLNLDEYSQELHRTFQSKYLEISSRCQSIGGIDSTLGVDTVDFGEEYWKNIKGWPAAFDYSARFLNTVHQLLEKNSCESNGLTLDNLSIIAEKHLNLLLGIASGVTEAKRSPEKLFCILYMCKALDDSAPSLRKLCSEDFASRAAKVLAALKDSAKGTLGKFKELIWKYRYRKVVQDGSILPITGYLMKYIRLLINHAGSLDNILGQQEYNGLSSTGRLVCGLIDDLHDVITEKSKLYAPDGLRGIFLLNNAHFIIQEVENSDTQLIVGPEWTRRRRHEFDQYMRNYMASSWEHATNCLTAAASPPRKRRRPILGFLQPNPRPLDSFIASFNDICSSQMHWKVPNPVLRYALRASIRDHVIGAYRAYLKQSVTGTAGDLEADLKTKVSDLFEG